MSPRQIALVGDARDPAVAAFVHEVHRRYLPGTVLARVAPGDVQSAKKLMSFLEAKVALGGKATAYVCRGGTCKLPAKDLETFEKQLDE